MFNSSVEFLSGYLSHVLCTFWGDYETSRGTVEQAVRYVNLDLGSLKGEDIFGSGRHIDGIISDCAEWGYWWKIWDREESAKHQAPGPSNSKSLGRWERGQQKKLRRISVWG